MNKSTRKKYIDWLRDMAKDRKEGKGFRDCALERMREWRIADMLEQDGKALALPRSGVITMVPPESDKRMLALAKEILARPPDPRPVGEWARDLAQQVCTIFEDGRDDIEPDKTSVIIGAPMSCFASGADQFETFVSDRRQGQRRIKSIPTREARRNATSDRRKEKKSEAVLLPVLPPEPIAYCCAKNGLKADENCCDCPLIFASDYKIIRDQVIDLRERLTQALEQKRVLQRQWEIRIESELTHVRDGLREQLDLNTQRIKETAALNKDLEAARRLIGRLRDGLKARGKSNAALLQVRKGIDTGLTIAKRIVKKYDRTPHITVQYLVNKIDAAISGVVHPEAVEEAVGRAISVEDLIAQNSDDELVRRAIQNARPRESAASKWSAVSEVFGINSSLSIQLCRRFGVDPNMITEVKGNWRIWQPNS